MEIQLKPATIANAEDIQRLSDQLGYPLPFEQVKRNLIEISGMPDHIALVAQDKEKVVGWAHAFRSVLLESVPFIELAGLVVDENYRGKRIGKKLMEAIIDWANDKKVSEIRVRSQVKRKEAHLFYTSIGFSEIKEQKVFEMNL